jgi:hypothetical protein
MSGCVRRTAVAPPGSAWSPLVPAQTASHYEWHAFQSTFMKIKCPSCFVTFDLQKVAFRCVNPRHREEDEVLKKFLGGSRVANMGHVITCGDKDWISPTEALCTCDEDENVRVKTTLRICPECHCELPRYIETIPNYPVYMVGPGQSGKSVYLAVTMKHLIREVFPSFSFHSTLDYSTGASDKKINQIEQIIQGLKLFPGNKGWRTEPELRQPFMLLSRIRSYVPFFYPLKRTNSANLVIFDTAGEDTQDENALLYSYQGFEHAAAMVFFIDPMGIPKMDTRRIQPSVNDPTRADSDPFKAINRVARVWRTVKKLPPEAKVSVPTALVLTKIDEVKLPSVEIFSKKANHRRGFDGNYCCVVSKALEDFLSDKEIKANDFIKCVQSNFSHYCLFPISSLGHTPIRMGEEPNIWFQLEHEPTPMHVENPILWILHQLRQLDEW